LKRIEPSPDSAPQTHASGVLVFPDLYIAGQVGMNTVTGDFENGMLAQTKLAIRNLVSVVEAAEGRAQDITKLTIYVVDIDAFRRNGSQITRMFRETFGSYQPAMTLVGVTDLLYPELLIEVEGHARVGASHD